MMKIKKTDTYLLLLFVLDKGIVRAVDSLDVHARANTLVQSEKKKKRRKSLKCSFLFFF